GTMGPLAALPNVNGPILPMIVDGSMRFRNSVLLPVANSKSTPSALGALNTSRILPTNLSSGVLKSVRKRWAAGLLPSKSNSSAWLVFFDVWLERMLRDVTMTLSSQNACRQPCQHHPGSRRKKGRRVEGLLTPLPPG